MLEECCGEARATRLMGVPGACMVTEVHQFGRVGVAVACTMAEVQMEGLKDFEGPD